MSGESNDSVAGQGVRRFAPARALGFVDRRRLADGLAEVVVRAGGIGVIASILAIVVFIAAEVWPLLGGAEVVASRQVAIEHAPQALALDPYRTLIASLDADRVVRVRHADTGLVAAERRVGLEDGAAIVASQASPDGNFLAAVSSAGNVSLVPIEWHVGFENRKRVVTAGFGVPSVFDLDEGQLSPPFAARLDPQDGSEAVAVYSGPEQLALLRRSREENDFTGELTESESRSFTAAPPDIKILALDDERENLYGAAPGGRLYRWSAKPRLSAKPELAMADGEITAMTLLLGGRALVVGLEDGGIQVWLRTPGGDDVSRLTLVRRFPPHAAPIRHLVSSRRDKGFLAVDEAGRAGLYYSTPERVLWRGGSGLGRVDAVAVAPKADGIVFAGPRTLSVFDVDNPHPDVSFWSLFGKVWYEGYSQPEYVWQSSGGSDDFEPKYSLTPLLIGTLKGTFYSLLIAIPLGVFGAMYTSQFMHPRLRNVIKPTVEIMAALPSVVLGFLAGLWLAPRVEETFSALILMVVAFPLVVAATGFLWERLPARLRSRVPTGSEAVVFAVTLACAGFACVALSDWFELLVFGGNFQSWLRAVVGLDYDQRNAIIVGLAMGFAVIPIIFAISEDAFSNVPRNLISGSLALGANRWQTVSRIVLPTASPGIFSAIMVGFGRAVGETMIVLMATGNTPIQEWNPFNGFRTLSANIAVEIPEAPQFGTLYRVLFLAALLLFIVTFVVNTAAELVRQRLRERYARL